MKKKLVLLVLLVSNLLNLYAVEITGEFIDKLKNSNIIHLHYIDRITNEPITIQKVDIGRGYKFKLNFEIDESGLYLINDIEIYVTKNDSIALCIKDNKVVETVGRNGGNYLYFSKFHTYYNNSYFEKKENGQSELDFKWIVDQYNSKIQKFRRDVNDEQLSDEFLLFLENDLWFSYLEYYVKNLSSRSINFNLDETTLIGSNNNSYYQSGLIYAIAHNVKDTLIESNQLFEWVNTLLGSNSYSSFYKDMFILEFVQILIDDIPHSSVAHNFMAQFIDEIKDKKVREQVQYELKVYKKIVDPLKKSIKESKLIDYNGNSIDFETLINKYQGFIVYLDFWAKWCGACIYEFPMIEKLNQSYGHKKFITVGISIDEEFEDFKIAADKYGLKVENQYFLVKNEDKTFKEFFELTELPKYFIWGRQGEILSFNSPRPNSKKLKIKLDKYFK